MKQNTDLTGKTIVITGATAGIGLAAATELAQRGAYVIGVGRSGKRCHEAEQSILNAAPHAHIDFAVADLSTQRAVRALADTIRAYVETNGAGKLDVLINNAGTVSSWYRATEDGYELQFAVNHLAPFLLTHELMPLLAAAPEARVITTSSSSHYRARMRWSDVMFRTGYNCLSAYKQSKLANVLFSMELNRRLGERASIRAYAADPGLVNTGIGEKGTSGIENWVWKRRRNGGATPEEGAATLVHLAAEPAVSDSDAVYWKDCAPKAPSSTAQKPEEAAKLWELSERLCGVKWLSTEDTLILELAQSYAYAR